MEKREFGNFVKKYYLTVLGTLYFFYIFYCAPPTGDRMMDGVLYYDLGDPWINIFGQVRWIQGANARVLSNIFSSIVDRNILIHACINALMVCGVVLLLKSILKNIYEKEISKCVEVLMWCSLCLVSWSIKKEVYFYATTL